MTAQPQPTWPQGMYGAPEDLYARSAVIKAGQRASSDALTDAAQDSTGPDAAQWLLEQSRRTDPPALTVRPYLEALEHGNREEMFTAAQLHAHLNAARRNALTQGASLTSDNTLAEWLLHRAQVRDAGLVHA